MKMVKNLISIIGTTGVGKSQLGVELAKALNGEIINGDSMQMYAGLDNMTNKHPIPEREGIPHHLLGHISWNHEYSVKQFEEEAIRLIDDIHARGKLPILVGGTHYYNQSILFKNSTVASSETIEKRQLSPEQLAILDSPDQVMDYLKKVDPVVAQKFHPNDTRRLRRALEIYFTTNKRASDIYSDQQNKTGTSDGLSLRYRSLVLWVWSDQGVLDPRLDARVVQMIDNGLYEELNEMYDIYKKSESPVDLERGVWQVIGFRQFLPWLKGETDSPDSGIDQMKLATRQYAKRQTKWIKKKLLLMMKEVGSREPDMGRVGLLDATDLSIWKDNVFKRGLNIAEDFINEKPGHSLAPAGLESMLDTRSSDEAFGQDKWKHFECSACMGSDMKPQVFVGESAWKQHIEGRKHKSVVRRQKKKEEFERWKRQKVENGEAIPTAEKDMAANSSSSN
ncbi:tRNA dimethylallyltransferase [Trichomonascus vanleenenianus]|uniref:tRNA dimethylallyltransferase n=1 Tax=Trichomonascus vanleenenianus TaxID=2268995 RepID=UPI003ECB8AA5